VDAFSPEQIDLLCALADNIAIAIENARLFRHERLEKEKALRDQAEARQIQRALLPEQEPVISGYARVANGGHADPIFVRGQTNITELKTEKGLPLGLMNSEYSEIELTLQSGDRVLFYTDGA
jgi:serine phosphatase RsbU (regulator of sigma subunit)